MSLFNRFYRVKVKLNGLGGLMAASTAAEKELVATTLAGPSGLFNLEGAVVLLALPVVHTAGENNGLLVR